MKKLYNTIYLRLTSETPIFFKKIVRIGLLCSALGGGLKAAGDVIPAKVSEVAGYLMTTGIVTTVVSNFAVKDSPELEKKIADKEA